MRTPPRPRRAAAPAFLAAVALSLALAGAVPAAAAEAAPVPRDGTVMGLEAGIGFTGVKFSSDGEEDSRPAERAFTGGLNVGWAWSDRLMGSVGIYGWKKTFGEIDNAVSLTTLQFLGELTWFPRGRGVWLRGGAGGGSVDLNATLFGQPIAYTKGGFAWTAGVGYETRITDATAVGLAYDLRWVRVGTIDFLDRTTAVTNAVSITLRYYM